LDSSTPIPTIPEPYDDERPRALVVSVAGRRFAIPVESVREVVRPRAITPVPGTPAIVRGLVNVRGMVVTVLHLGELLRGAGVTDSAPHETVDVVSSRAVLDHSIVLLEHAGRAVGVLVDAVHDVRPLEDVSEATDAGPSLTDGDASAGGTAILRLDLPALLARVMLSSEEGP
jgi:purine-binding chemotaxis protein CheW